ncbi:MULTISPECIES: magnesium transporter protection protein MgtU [Klebsiella]
MRKTPLDNVFIRVVMIAVIIILLTIWIR